MKVAPYGTWRSPLAAAAAVGASLRLSEPRAVAGSTFWIEGRPAEGGRCALVRCDPSGACADVLPAGFSARSRVNEYGGGVWCTDGTRLCFVHDEDQCVYALEPGGPRRLVPQGARRHADLVLDPQRPVVYCVREDHDAGGEPETTLAAIDLRAGGARVLARGADFYAAPAPSPDGRRIAWIEWRHPHMPWDATELWVADLLDGGALGARTRIAGGARESVQQPRWHRGSLYFVSDADGWWNLYRWDGAQVARITRERAELAGAQWVFATATYAPIGNAALCVAARDGVRRLIRADLDDGHITDVPTPFTEIEGLHADGGRAVFIGAHGQRPRAIVELDLASGAWHELRASSPALLDADDIALPQALAFPTGEGETAHAYYYGPRNEGHTAPAGERPPVVVRCHGGPTSAASTALDLRTQYWTTRGFALLDVDYRGSTGYGRPYRERLYGNWGLFDVEDCVGAASHAAQAGLADGERAVISGSSAGGYTVLCALVASDRFRAGASLYGIGDLALLIADTHKFEAHYTQRLVGPDPATWRERSPLHRVERIRRPVLLLQGAEDRVVPPEQSRRMAAALRARGVPVAYVEFAGEGHGFRRGETLRRALEAELDFHARVLGIEPADRSEPVVIEPPLP
jgi:dipeptidyl aminopeptidase/acylaminoacyl peptidase